ncbi:MAG: hypothetical protein RR192_03525, partial [Peptostreptococcaceae bacterium]
MNKVDIKNVIGKVVPNKEMEKRLSEKVFQNQHKKFPLKNRVSIAASVAIIVFIGILGYNYLVKEPNNSPGIISSAEGIYIPKLELPKDTNASMSMIGLIVY